MQKQYRKRPIVIWAEQYIVGEQPPTAVVPLPTWKAPHHPKGTMWIETLEGPHIVSPNDWIITGISGEKYPCKPDIFEATYDRFVLGDEQPMMTIEEELGLDPHDRPGPGPSEPLEL